jgi:hypothetical protein
MFSKTSIALAFIVALASGAVAAEKRGLNAFGNDRTIVHCLHGTWDAYALRCDSGE